MPIDLITVPIALKMPTGRGCSTGKITGEALVPDIKPDITRVLMSDFVIGKMEHSIKSGKCMVSGEMEIQFVYASVNEDQQVMGFKQTLPFNMEVDVLNLSEEMRCEMECKVASFEAKPVTPRKIHIAADLQCCVKAFDCSEKVVIKDIVGKENVQTLKEGREMKKYLGNSKDNVNVMDIYDLPTEKQPIWEILYTNVELGTPQVRQTSGFAEVEGEANVSLLYSTDSEEREVDSLEFSVPYNATMRLDEIPEAEELDLKTALDYHRVEAIEDDTGMLRRLNLEALVSLNLEGYENVVEDVVVDAFSPEMEMEVFSGSVCQDKVTSQVSGNFSASKNIKIEEPLPPVQNIIITIARIKNYNLEMKDGKAVISGNADARVVYNGEDKSGLRGIATQVPFEAAINLEDGKGCVSNISKIQVAKAVSNIISPDEIEIKLEIHYDVQQTCRCEQRMNADIKTGAVRENPHKDDVIVYMAKAGDSVWKIAKSFSVKTSDIIKMDGQPVDELEAGQKVFIL